MFNGRLSVLWSEIRVKGREIGCLMKIKGMLVIKFFFVVILGFFYFVFLCLESYMFMREVESESIR